MVDILYVIILAIAITAAYGCYSAAPWVPTRKRERTRLVEHLALRGDERVYDLGCGNGALLFSLVDAYPAITAIGYDVALLPLFLGWAKKLFSPRKYRNVRLYWRNLFTASIADADLIFIFLLPKAYSRLQQKFAKEIPDNARVALEGWPFANIAPKTTLPAGDCLPVYIYQGEQFKLL